MFGWFKKKKVLLDIGDYEFPEVVLQRTRYELGITYCQLKLIEVSLKDFFYTVQTGVHLELTNSNVDVLWHNFILDTKSYKKFCDDYIGFFIDHVPFLNGKHLSDSALELNLMKIKKAAPPHWESKRDNIIHSNQLTSSDNDFLLWAIYLNVLSEDNSTNNYITPVDNIIHSSGSDNTSNYTEPESTKSTTNTHSGYSGISESVTTSHYTSSDSSAHSHKSSCSSCSSCSSSSGD